MEKLLSGIRFGHLATGAMVAWSASGAHGKHQVLSELGAAHMENAMSHLKRA